MLAGGRAAHKSVLLLRTRIIIRHHLSPSRAQASPAYRHVHRLGGGRVRALPGPGHPGHAVVVAVLVVLRVLWSHAGIRTRVIWAVSCTRSAMLLWVCTVVSTTEVVAVAWHVTGHRSWVSRWPTWGPVHLVWPAWARVRVAALSGRVYIHAGVVVVHRPAIACSSILSVVLSSRSRV